MPIVPEIPAWAGPAPTLVTNVADLTRNVSNLDVKINAIAPGTVSGQQIAARTITNADIATGTITATEIAAGTITADEIAAGSITATEIAANTITAGNISAGAITAGAIAAGAITAGAIAANAVTAGTIAVNAVTAGTIAANAVTSSTIAANAITSAAISAGAVNSAAISANAIQTINIAANAVTSAQIASGAVQASNISVTSLSAVSSVMGTVTGGIFQTGTSGARVMFGTGMTTPTGVTAGIVGIDASNNVTFSIDATTGNVALKGNIQTGSTGLGNIAGITQNAVLNISGGNEVDNANLATSDLTPFSASNGTLAYDTTTWVLAPASLKVTIGTTANYLVNAAQTGNVRMPVTAAKVYSIGAWVLTPTAVTVGAYISWYGSSGFLSNSAQSMITTVPGQWVRVTCNNITAPAGATTAYAVFFGSGHAAADVHRYEEFLFVQQPTAVGAAIIANSITADEITAATITGTQIAAVSITGGNIAAGTITAVNIAAGSISAAQISSTAGITGSQIATTTITGGNIATGAITASNISAGAIDGMTITGATIRTSYGFPNMTMDSTGIYVQDSSGVTQVAMRPTAGLNLNVGAGSINQINWYSGGSVAGSVYCASNGTLWMSASPTGGSPGSIAIWPFGVQATYNGQSVGIVDASGVTSLRTVTAINSVTVGVGDMSYLQLGIAGAGASNGVQLQLRSLYGALPGFPGSIYPTLLSTYADMYISVGGGFSAYIDSGGNYFTVSSKNRKRNFRKLDHKDVHGKIALLDLREWEHTDQPGVKNIGPLAEDFHAKFGLGRTILDPAKRTEPEHEPMISAAHVAGVALLGVQGLIKRVEELEAVVTRLQSEARSATVPQTT